MAQTTVPVPLIKSSVTTSSGTSPFVVKNEASSSGISWAAVGAGSFITAASLLSLSALGAGAGLSSLSPWSNSGLSTSAVGMGALLWVCLAEIVACALGGYLAGRLRTKWVDVHSDEVYFRDTAHGFLVWAVSFVLIAAFLTSAGTRLAGGENRAATSARTESEPGDTNRYFIDSLFRSGQLSSIPDEALRSGIGVIFAHGIQQRELSADDKNYIAGVVAAKTGMTNAEAESRVSEVFANDQQAVETARKALAHSLYWMFLALLLGAFAASLAATFGGKQRDHMRTI